MKMKEIREKSDAELKGILQINKEKLRSLRFKVAQKQVKDVRSLRDTKKDLARFFTEIKHRKEANQSKKSQ